MDKLNKTVNSLDIDVDFIVTHPYWVYSVNKKDDKLLLDKKLNIKVDKLICNSFKSTKKINKILITKLSNSLELKDLTYDRRHFMSQKIKLREYEKACSD